MGILVCKRQKKRNIISVPQSFIRRMGVQLPQSTSGGAHLLYEISFSIDVLSAVTNDVQFINIHAYWHPPGPPANFAKGQKRAHRGLANVIKNQHNDMGRHVKEQSATYVGFTSVSILSQLSPNQLYEVRKNGETTELGQRSLNFIDLIQEVGTAKEGAPSENVQVLPQVPTRAMSAPRMAEGNFFKASYRALIHGDSPSGAFGVFSAVPAQVKFSRINPEGVGNLEMFNTSYKPMLSPIHRQRYPRRVNVNEKALQRFNTPYTRRLQNMLRQSSGADSAPTIIRHKRRLRNQKITTPFRIMVPQEVKLSQLYITFNAITMTGRSINSVVKMTNVCVPAVADMLINVEPPMIQVGARPGFGYRITVMQQDPAACKVKIYRRIINIEQSIGGITSSWSLLDEVQAVNSTPGIFNDKVIKLRNQIIQYRAVAGTLTDRWGNTFTDAVAP